MMKTKPFQGASVFMSRNLVPPELFDTLHDALKLNGADVFLCCDPSRNGPSDFHEKFEDLRAKGCKLVGPQCVVSCAKERRPLPQKGYTCCLAMEGVKVLASGFEVDEKAEIEKLVTSMGGILQSKTLADVSFVIAKNVLAAKYKWALNVLKKPVVTINWLYQCRNEHRVVPQESYRVLPFSGLTISVTGIPADARKEIQKSLTQNGGKYSAELTRKCTHLIAEAPEGDKYKVAKRWGHIHIVNRKWFDQSTSRKACLNEESYPVQGSSMSSVKTASSQQNQDRVIGSSQSLPSSIVGDRDFHSISATDHADPDLETTLSQNVSSMFVDPHVLGKEDSGEVPAVQSNGEVNHDGCVAADSENEDNDLYLSECRLTLVGFESSELRNLVNMVRRGGASRYTTLNERLTHVVVGLPSESEKKEVRSIASMGLINVVRRGWLEDCDREKKEVPVLQKHIALDLLVPKGSICFSKGPAINAISMNQGSSNCAPPKIPADQMLSNSNGEVRVSFDKREQERITNGRTSLEGVAKPSELNVSHPISNEDKVPKKTWSNCITQDGKASSVFKGRTFHFSNTFPEDRRDEIIEWVNQGGGAVVGDHETQNVHFMIECHGVKPKDHITGTIYVSSHWIRCCLEDGYLLDVDSHVLYSPLPCRVPLPGFESLRFCVSQYEEKDRLLLRNLCFTLGAKFVLKLTRKVTHLLCKFRNGQKYEAACKWGIKSVTCDWIYECVRQNKLIPSEQFCPKEVSEQEAGLCAMTQFPSQIVQTISGDHPSQFPSQSQDMRITQNQNRHRFSWEEIDNSSSSKKARVTPDNAPKDLCSFREHLSYPTNNSDCSKGEKLNNSGEAADAVPDVAAAIEDLLEQTSKIHDLKSPVRIACDRGVSFLSGQEHSGPPTVVGLSKQWINRSQKNENICNPSVNANALDGFSETQTDSQVVGYEEDLSGRQMIIDRVRTQSSMS
ncbi:DNA topoisomerase 2-binding protein 1-like isoform X3 [Eucalyptus grandis]|uniref:DNA topoisomerase 2-binding protein 1-like isoform X3 n=1 Tax=Eucalyptus grandis TaxID=71139 RepID=UPI00192ECACB|nr:DNA topoisomerase 2-binding protein 1-like isoform X3 [Eucalyptus grandis]